MISLKSFVWFTVSSCSLSGIDFSLNGPMVRYWLLKCSFCRVSQLPDHHSHQKLKSWWIKIEPTFLIRFHGLNISESRENQSVIGMSLLASTAVQAWQHTPVSSQADCLSSASCLHSVCITTTLVAVHQYFWPGWCVCSHRVSPWRQYCSSPPSLKPVMATDTPNETLEVRDHSTENDWVSISNDPLEVNAALKFVADPGAGASTVFLGTVIDKID